MASISVKLDYSLSNGERTPIVARIIADLLRYRIGVAAQEGVDPVDILVHAGVDPTLMTNTCEFYDAADERAIWEAIVALTERDDIGLLCGTQFSTQVNGMLGYVMANSQNLGLAIDKLCRYQRVLGDTMGMRLELGKTSSTIFIDLWSEWHDSLRYTIDMFLSAALSWAENNTMGRVRPIHVGFNYQRPVDQAPYSSLFAPAPVEFGCESSYLIYTNDSLDAPILGANRVMFKEFEDKVIRSLADLEGRDTMTFKVHQQILKALVGSAPNINEISGRLAVSARKMQRILKDEGESYSSLLAHARRDLAIQYLKEKQVSHAEIAYLLGFSEVSVFSRSFKKWTGQSPTEFINSGAKSSS